MRTTRLGLAYHYREGGSHRWAVQAAILARARKRDRGGGGAVSISVFLADDHAIVRDGVRSLLEAQPDIRVVGDTGNGRDAVALAPILFT